MRLISDYSQGFGGKFGVQKDRQDKAAVGWDYHEKTEKHASQKGVGMCEGTAAVPSFFCVLPSGVLLHGCGGVFNSDFY